MDAAALGRRSKVVPKERRPFTAGVESQWVTHDVASYEFIALSAYLAP